MRRALLLLALTLSGCGSGAGDFPGVWKPGDVSLEGCGVRFAHPGNVELRQGVDADLVYLDFFFPGCDVRLAVDGPQADVASAQECAFDLTDDQGQEIHTVLQIKHLQLRLDEGRTGLSENDQLHLVFHQPGGAKDECDVHGTLQAAKVAED